MWRDFRSDLLLRVLALAAVLLLAGAIFFPDERPGFIVLIFPLMAIGAKKGQRSAPRSQQSDRGEDA